MRRHRIFTALFCVLAGVCFLRVTGLLADTTLQIAGEGFDYVYYDPPNERQIKYKLSFSSADPVGANALLKGVKIEQFAVTGGNPQMVAETPECIYDNKHAQVSSGGALQVHGQDGKLFVEGVGFFLQITNSSLVISNEVHSIFQFQTASNTPALASTEIFSHRGEYLPRNETTNGLVIYEGNVRLLDPRVKLTGEFLTAELPKDEIGQTNRVNRIVALTNVVIDFINTNGEQIQALAQRAVYDRVVEPTAGARSIAPQAEPAVTNETLELTGNPRINLTNGWMTADAFVINRATEKLRGSNNFHFHYVAQNEQTSSPPPPETQISSDQFEFDLNTHLAQFWGHVQVDDRRMQLTSENLAAELPQTGTGQANHINHILAETNVTIDFSDEKTGQQIHTTSQKATYDYHVLNATTNQVLELTVNPTVEITGTNRAGWMTADVITVDRAQGRIWGVGNHHSVFKKQPGESATMDTEIFSDRFDFAMATSLSVYQGNVRAYDPEMNLTSRTLTLKLGKAANGQTNRIERVDAVGNVVIDFIEKPFATGDLTNLPAFAARLKQPAPDDAVARYVRSQLPSPTRQLLSDYEPAIPVPSPPLGERVRVRGSGDDSQLQQALVTNLNRLAQSGAIYETARFTNVFLSHDTVTLLRQQPMGTDLIQLNRLLLLDAFRGELARGQAGEKVLATCDHAVYSNTITDSGTNVVLELSGHPKLEKPNGWTTAEKTIIYNRTTGVTHFVGQPHFHTKLEGLAKMPAAGKKAPN